MSALIIKCGEISCTVNVENGTTISDAIAAAGFSMAMPCAGNHTCGKCKVHVTGSVSEMAESERRLLTSDDIRSGKRLSCCARINGDAVVMLNETDTYTLSDSVLPEHTLTETGFGLAVDVGTTTVAMRLYDRASGVVLAESLMGNEQERFGADVISRITCSVHDGAEPLRRAITDQLERMAAVCMKHAGVSAADAVVIAGNTTMLHFYEGLETAGIAVAPFTPASLFGRCSQQRLAGQYPFLPPCIGAYIGADIICAVLAAGMPEHEGKTEILADLGTNGEIVLWHEGRLWCASTAAGPAFEGASLSCGMRAGKGAVTKVWIENGTVHHTVSGGGVPSGICGSGILDAVAVMLSLGVIDETGLMDDDCGMIEEYADQDAWRIPGTNVFVTQTDIRQIQLAKAAVCAGIQTLLKYRGVSEDAVDTFYVAGGFGHYMNAENAARIGLFPSALQDKLTVIGNGSLAGASLLLLDRSMFAKAMRISELAVEVPLSGNRVFSDLYMDGMLF